MNDDIVTRLREHAEDEAMPGNDWLRDAMRDGANEIERLRLACHFLAGWITFYDRTIDAKGAVETAYEKSVRYV